MKTKSKRLASQQSALREARINVGKRKSQENKKVLRRLSKDQGASTVKEELAIACSVICPTIETRRKNSGALHTRSVSAERRFFLRWPGVLNLGLLLLIVLKKIRKVCLIWLSNMKRTGLVVWMEGCPVSWELVLSLHSLQRMAGNGQHWWFDGYNIAIE